MSLKWLPLKYIVRRLAYSHGFIDPIRLLYHIRRFSQPSEVNVPVELLRAGVVLHARGLINSRVIQNNLDWTWPYWVNRQFKPQSDAFIPRAFSLTQINLSARNWTAVGLPDFPMYPVVDPRGLVMPFWDSWSIDAWIISEDGKLTAPAALENVSQKLGLEHNLSVITCSEAENLTLRNSTQVESSGTGPVCKIHLQARTGLAAWLVVSVRPYNPEGISFIHQIKYEQSNKNWIVNKKHNVLLSESPEKHIVSDYRSGDVALKLLSCEDEQKKVSCKVGMATAAAMYKIEPDEKREIQIAIPLDTGKADDTGSERPGPSIRNWKQTPGEYCRINMPDKNFNYLYEAAIRSVVLHSPGEIYPGPYTYKRFWFRDAVFIIHALLRAGMIERAEKLINAFFPRQTRLGYFCSQHGEWDSNGQVLWIINRYCRLTHTAPEDSWIRPVIRAARWIIRKRVNAKSSLPHAGLMPAGFSAEHLGTNDFYYWDDFWSVAGLFSAAQLMEKTDNPRISEEFKTEAKDLLANLERTLKLCRHRLGRPAMPASPYRRLDSGAIGSLVACYPLQLFEPDDERVEDTARFLMDNCIVEGAFFHDITHSGINPYLTLHLAQVLMRRGDSGFTGLVENIAGLASPTGQWPEAINPRTRSGCMGDGQHVWASAEWILMMINCFVTEENGKLVIGSGLFPEWLENEYNMSIGPVLTDRGPVNIRITGEHSKAKVSWKGNWNRRKPDIEIRLPGCKPVIAGNKQTCVEIERKLKV